MNLPVTSVRDLVVHENDLVVATFGRAFWILDDMTPLRHVDRKVEASEAWLFAPETAYRVRPGWDQGTPVPTDEALAENPPDGAVLDYYLKEKSTSPVQLEIFDCRGEIGSAIFERRQVDPDETGVGGIYHELGARAGASAE